MRVILSRKGFDSGYGGYPSPILPNGEMLSIPIPIIEKDIPYNQIKVEENITYSNLMEGLYGDSIKVERKGKFNLADLSCHLDPDIRMKSYKRHKEWTGLFGQAGPSQSHLVNQGVTIGDIFLYFGWYRDTIQSENSLKFVKGNNGYQALYGYLQVGEIHKINAMTPPEWMKYHPHIKRGIHARDNDVIYVAAKKLSLNNQLSGYGVFKYSPDLKLTKDGLSRSRWSLPDFMKKVKISYHSDKSWKEDYFQSAAKGQEFVVQADKHVINWTKELIEKHVM